MLLCGETSFGQAWEASLLSDLIVHAGDSKGVMESGPCLSNFASVARGYKMNIVRNGDMTRDVVSACRQTLKITKAMYTLSV